MIIFLDFRFIRSVVFKVEQYNDLAEKLKIHTAIIVNAYNRPKYLQKVVEALEKNEESQLLPFIFILDGGAEATQQENIEVIARANIRYKFVICHDCNQGCGRALIGARRFAFETCKFERAIFFEDDLIVSPYYIRLVLNLYDFVKEHYDNVGIVQCYNRCLLSEEDKELCANLIIEPFRGFWGYCMDRDTYNAVSHFMDEHEEKHLINIPKEQSNAILIAQWLEKMFRKYDFQESNNTNNSYKTAINWKGYYNDWVNRLKGDYQNKHRDGQDYEFRLALHKAGIVRIATMVSRAEYIGKSGIHHTDDCYSQYGYEHIKLFNCDEDKYRKIFSCKKCNTSNVLIDLCIFKNKLKYTELKKLIDSLFENGCDVIIKNYHAALHSFITHYNILHFNQIDHHSKKFTEIIPIKDKNDLANIKLEEQKMNKINFYILDEKVARVKNEILQKVLKLNGYLIAANQKVKNQLLITYGNYHIVMWHEVMRKFFKIG